MMLLLGEPAYATFIQGGFNPHGPVEACGAYEVDGATAVGNVAYNSSHHVYTFDGLPSPANPTGTLDLTAGSPAISSSNCCTDSMGYPVTPGTTNFPTSLTLQTVQGFSSTGGDTKPTQNFPYYDSNGYVIFNPYGSRSVYCPSPARSGSSLYLGYDQDEVYQMYEQDVAKPGIASSNFFSPAITVSQRYCVGGLFPYPTSSCSVSLTHNDFWPALFWYNYLTAAASETLLLAEFTAGASTGSNITFPMPACWKWMCMGAMVSGTENLNINQCDHIGTGSVVRMCARLAYSGIKGVTDYLGNSHSDYYNQLGNRTAIDADYRTSGRGNPYAGPYSYPVTSGTPPVPTGVNNLINNIYVVQTASNPGTPFTYAALTNGVLTGSTSSTTPLTTGNLGSFCAATPASPSCNWVNNLSTGGGWAGSYAPGGSAYSLNPSGIAEMPLQATQQVTMPNGATQSVNVLLRLKNGRIVNPREQLCAYLDPGDLMDPDWATTQWAQHNQPNPKATHLYAATFGQVGTAMSGKSGAAAQGTSVGLIGAGVLFAGAGPFIAATAAAFAIVDAITANLNTVVVMNEGCVDLVLGPYPPPPTIRIQPTIPTISSQPICTMTTKAFPNTVPATSYTPYYQNPEDVLPTCSTTAIGQDSATGAQCNCAPGRMSTSAHPCDMPSPQNSVVGAQCNCPTGRVSTTAAPCDVPGGAILGGTAYSASNPDCAPSTYVTGATYAQSNLNCAAPANSTPTNLCTCPAGRISTDAAPCLPPDANPSLICACPYGEVVPAAPSPFNFNGSSPVCATTLPGTITPATTSGYTPGFSTFEQPRVRIGYNDVLPFCVYGQSTTQSSPCACPYAGGSVSNSAEVDNLPCIQWNLSNASSGYSSNNSGLVDSGGLPYARLAYQSAAASNGVLTRTAYGIMVGDYEDAEDDYSANYTFNIPGSSGVAPYTGNSGTPSAKPGMEKARCLIAGAGGGNCASGNVVAMNLPHISSTANVTSDNYFLAMDNPTQICIFAKGTGSGSGQYCTAVNSVLALSGGSTYTCTSADLTNFPEALCINRPYAPNPVVSAVPNGDCASLPDPIDSQNAIPQLCTSYTHPVIQVSLGDNNPQAQIIGAKTGNECTTLHGISYCSLVEGNAPNQQTVSVPDNYATGSNPTSYTLTTWPNSPPGLTTGPYQYPNGQYNGTLPLNPFSWSSGNNITVNQPSHGLPTSGYSTSSPISVTFTGLTSPITMVDNATPTQNDGNITLTNNHPYQIQSIPDSNSYTITPDSVTITQGSGSSGGGSGIVFNLPGTYTAMPNGGSCTGVLMTINKGTASATSIPMGCHCIMPSSANWAETNSTISGSHYSSPVQTYNTCPANPNEDGYQRGGIDLCLNYGLSSNLVRTMQQTVTTNVGLATTTGRTVSISDQTRAWQEWQNSTGNNQCNCGYNYGTGTRVYNSKAPCDDAAQNDGLTYSAQNPTCAPGYVPTVTNLTYEQEDMDTGTPPASLGTMTVKKATCTPNACGNPAAITVAQTDLQNAMPGCRCQGSETSTTVAPCDSSSTFTGEPYCPSNYMAARTTQPGAVVVVNSGTASISTNIQNLVQNKGVVLPVPFPQTAISPNDPPDLSNNPCTVLMLNYIPGAVIGYFNYTAPNPNIPPLPYIPNTITGLPASATPIPCSGTGSRSVTAGTPPNQPDTLYEAVTSGAAASQYCQPIPNGSCPAIMEASLSFPYNNVVNPPYADSTVGYAEWFTGGDKTNPGPVAPGPTVATQCDEQIMVNGVLTAVTLTMPPTKPSKTCLGSNIVGANNEGLVNWSTTTTGSSCYVCPEKWFYMAISNPNEFVAFKLPASVSGTTITYQSGFSYHGCYNNNTRIGIGWDSFTASCDPTGAGTTTWTLKNGTPLNGSTPAAGATITAPTVYGYNHNASYASSTWPGQCGAGSSVSDDGSSRSNNDLSANVIQNGNGKHIACGYSNDFSAINGETWFPFTNTSPPSTASDTWPSTTVLNADCNYNPDPHGSCPLGSGSPVNNTNACY